MSGEPTDSIPADCPADALRDPKRCCCDTGFNPTDFKVERPSLKSGPPISSLRDHVIRAIQRSNTVLYPNEWHPLTDALIAELGLRREDWNEGHSDRHRWVSRWMP